MVDIIVLPFSLASLWSNYTILSALKLSSPEVGSSSKTREGSVISSTPIDVLFLSPPDRVFFVADPITVSATASNPRSLKTSSTFSTLSFSEHESLSLAAKCKACLGEKCANKTSSYIT
jgi:hypothetical protein